MEMKVKLGIFLNNKLHLDIIFISKQNYIKKNFFFPAAFFPTLLSVTAPAHRNKQPFTPVVILESPVNRTWLHIFELWENTYRQREDVQSLHRKAQMAGLLKSRKFLL